MNIKLKILVILLFNLFVLSNISKAITLVGWDVDNLNLYNGRVYIPQAGATISIKVYLDRNYTSGVPNPNVTFVLASFLTGSSTSFHTLSSVFTVTDADFNGNTYLIKTVSITLTAAQVAQIVNETITIQWDQTGGSNYVFGSNSYSTTGQINGVVYTRFTLPSWKHDPLPLVTLYYGEPVFSTNDYIPLLSVNQSISSPSGNYTLILQSDGNVVLYSSNHTVMWTTDTNGSSGRYLFFQSDGNLVLTTNSNRTGVVWASNIYTRENDPGLPLSANAKYVLQDDGNFVMLIDSRFIVNPSPGYYRVLVDTGSGNNSVSAHFHVLN